MISIVAILLSIWLLVNKLDEALHAAVALAAGLLIYLLYKVFKKPGSAAQESLSR